MLFKEVIVYTSYCEYSINRDSEIIAASSLEEAAKISRNKTHLSLEDEVDDEYIETFFTNIRTKDGVAMLDHGEEDVCLIIPFSHKFFDLVEKDELYDTHFQEWREFIESFMLESTTSL